MIIYFIDEFKNSYFPPLNHLQGQFSASYTRNFTDSIKFIHQLIAKGDLPSIWASQFSEMPSYFTINSV